MSTALSVRLPDKLAKKLGSGSGSVKQLHVEVPRFDNNSKLEKK